MRSFDLLTWEVVRINLYLTEFILGLIAPLIKDPRESLKLQRYILSANVLKTMNLDDVPSIARSKMLNQGRFIIFLVVGSTLLRTLWKFV